MEIYKPGSTIGQYEVVSKPMMGGMGVVYFCIDHLNDGRHIALKTFRPELLPDREARDRFLREGTAWVKLGNHPHIVRCHAVDYFDPTAFLSLELITKEQRMENASLRPWMNSPMNVEQALLFALQISRGLAYANSKIPGFVHRDLKPENILVGTDRLSDTNINRLRVTDFGLATLQQHNNRSLTVDDDEGLFGRTNLTEGIVGTPLYMAPEQWERQQEGVYTDVYALGCILYEMLTAQHIVKGQSISDLRTAHCKGQLQAMPADIPNGVKTLLARCLSVQPVERYQSWEELIREIEDICINDVRCMVPVEMSGARIRHDEMVQESCWSHITIGRAYMDFGKLDVAVLYFERALAFAKESGNLRGEAGALTGLGIASDTLGVAKNGIANFEKALSIYRAIEAPFEEGDTLNNIGESYRRFGNSRQAVTYFQSALAIAQKVDYGLGQVIAMNNLGLIFEESGNVKLAIEIFQHNLALSEKTKNRRMQQSTVGNLGSLYANLGYTRQAIDCYKRALDLAREIGDQLGESKALGGLASVYLDLGDEHRMLEYCELALKITREIGDRHEECGTLNNMAEAFRRLNDLKQAIEFGEQALEIAREIGDRKSEASGNWNLGIAYRQAGDIERAIAAMENCVNFEQSAGHPDAANDAAMTSYLRTEFQNGAPLSKLLLLGVDVEKVESIKQYRQLVNSLMRLGGSCLEMYKNDAASCYFESILQLAREMNDQVWEARALSSLGIVYSRTKQLDRALYCHEQQLRIVRELGDRTGEGHALGNMGLVYGHLGKYEESLSCFQQHLEIARELGNKTEQALTLDNMGNVYGSLGQSEQARTCFEQHLVIARELEDIEGCARASFNLAVSSVQQEHLEQALTYAQQALGMFEQTGQTEYIDQSHQLVGKIELGLRQQNK